MNRIKKIIAYLTIILFCSICNQTSPAYCSTEQNPGLQTLTGDFRKFLLNNDIASASILVPQIITLLKTNTYKNELYNEANYYLGIYYSFAENNYKAVEYLGYAIAGMESMERTDTLYSKANYNMCFALSNLGDFYKLEEAAQKSIEIGKLVNSRTHNVLIESYVYLAIAKLELQKYDEVISLSNEAIELIGNKPVGVALLNLTYIYHNLGVCYLRMSDFSNAKLYLEKTESIIIENKLTKSSEYVNLLNSLSGLYINLNLPQKADECIVRAIAIAESEGYSNRFNIINSYAIIIGNAGKQKRGEELLRRTLAQSKALFGEGSRRHMEVVINYANYLREYKIDYLKSIEYFGLCLEYLDKNSTDLQLRSSVYLGYGQSLAKAGRSEEALGIIQMALFSVDMNGEATPLSNPDISEVKNDRKSLRVLAAKYSILCDLYTKKNDILLLEAEAATSELIIKVLEKVRIGINEEESRIILGDRYRNAYLNCIRDFNLLYTRTNEIRYLEKAFTYSEKSKVAGLLTSTRELKASQFQIPVEVSELESRLRKDIGIYNDYISLQLRSEKPDSEYLNDLRERLLNTTRKRDSLILFFENEYPEYYSVKYNTKVAELKDIENIVGRNANYINYVSSDTLLYIFVVNRKYQNLIAVPVDSSFFTSLKSFRRLFSQPLPSDNAREAFRKYVETGYVIYNKLINPIKPYLISDYVIISPDNLLSLIPFEALPVSGETDEDFSYKKLPYLMDDLDISYTYSATFMSESVRNRFNFDSKLIAFAPEYPEPIDIKQVMNSRQSVEGNLPDLPYARDEARYVAEISEGKLYLKEDASESNFKAESGNYDIIHLAMHTLLNDLDPMFSTLIFNKDNNSVEDGLLKTYELYSIPLKARMVVLSSCNTGNGLLSSGEGILSLARGFMYSGSNSVVMSLWEIEDKSGTEIVEYFYSNLIKGKSKSEALKNARYKYLKGADSLRSHPYFWATLVIYGDNGSLFYNKKMFLIAVFASTFIAFLLIIYFRKRRYS